MMVHTVLFWLRKDLAKQELAEFHRDLSTLPGVPSVRHGFIGTPSPTDRPVIDSSYSYGLTLAFDNLAGHDAYQTHPTHLAFVERNKDKWTRVQIYDFQ